MIIINNFKRDLIIINNNKNYYNYSVFIKIINNICFILNLKATSHIYCNKNYFIN